MQSCKLSHSFDSFLIDNDEMSNQDREYLQIKIYKKLSFRFTHHLSLDPIGKGKDVLIVRFANLVQKSCKDEASDLHNIQS